MSDIKLQIKRGQSENIGDVNLEAGEPAFALDTGKLYIGDGTNIVEINPDLGTAARKDIGTGSGNIPVLDSDGRLDESILPDLTIIKAGLNLENVTNESKETMFTDSALTGIPTAPTADSANSSIQIATTEFVHNVISASDLITESGGIDGGTF